MNSNETHLPFKILATIAAICKEKKMQHVIISPGSRSAPLTVSFARQTGITCRVIMDERAAGFIALGLAQQTQSPVGLICTSGTAALNYGPAVTEAFYQKIPLVIFSADRPPEWIDQQDNQTIRQAKLYGPHCRGSFELPVDYSHPDAQWHAKRIISEALNLSLWPIPGPVQVNVPLREPLYLPQDVHVSPEPTPKKIEIIPSEATLDAKTWSHLLDDWQRAKQKLIIAGMHPPDATLSTALASLQLDPSVVLSPDITANIQADCAPLQHADMILSTKSDETLQKLKASLLISFGGPLVSKSLKVYLRKYRPEKHWHIDPAAQTSDTYQSLTQIIPLAPRTFFEGLAKLIAIHAPFDAGFVDDNYQNQWLSLDRQASTLLTHFLEKAPFGEFAAIYQIMQSLPNDSYLQLGNSMPIRYANYIGLGPEIGTKILYINANRGTSGIDGCVSTTVGAAMSTSKITTLITGNLAFFYDRNALWHRHIPSNLRIVILNNGGGGIFKLINGPSNLPQAELNEYFFTPHPLTAKNTATDHNCAYFHCATAKDLAKCLPQFFGKTQKAAILEIETSSEVNATVFEDFKSKLALLNTL